MPPACSVREQNWLDNYQSARLYAEKKGAGANGNISEFILPRGILGAFSGLGWYYPDGWVVNRQGVKIDHEVRPTLEGVREGRDEVLETALNLIEANTEEE